MFNKVIIYGHKLHTHTHSYIHQAFYQTFRRKGFETYWFDSSDDLGQMDLSNSLFLTEGQVTKNIPVRSDCKYLLHFVEKEDIQNLGIKQENLLNFRFFENKSKTYEKVNDFSYYDPEKKELFLPWAATLFPEQIEKCVPRVFNPEARDVNFIGSIWSVNQDYILSFEKSCKKHGKNFVWRRLLSDKEYYYYTINSYATIDFRGKVHLEIGYLPCRIFKSLSCGIPPGTNSPFVKQAFGDYVYYNANSEEILSGTADFWNSKSEKEIRDSMAFIRDKHTYMNRVDDLLGVLNDM